MPKPKVAPLQFSTTHGLTGQLPLFMTAREIEETFQPLDADREFVYGRSTDDYFHGSGEETDEELYARKLEEAGMTYEERRGYTPRKIYLNRQGKMTARSATYGEPNTADLLAHSEALALWRRGDTDTHPEPPGKRIPHQKVIEPDMSLEEQVLHHNGNIPGVISLSTVQFGGQGRPEIVGGHHRMAVMREHFPDQPMPVEFFNNIFDAKFSGHYQ